MLVIERFDRRWTRDGRLLRLPQEDCCQALSIPPTNKYENEGGPGVIDILGLLKGSDEPLADQFAFFKSQLLFWMIGATDGHAKNFSIFLFPGGRYRLTPIYDVLTAQPSLDAKQIDRNKLKLAMAVGTNHKYRILDIHGHHFVETGKAAGLSGQMIRGVIADIIEVFDHAFKTVEQELRRGFPGVIAASVRAAAETRLRALDGMEIDAR